MKKKLFNVFIMALCMIVLPLNVFANESDSNEKCEVIFNSNSEKIAFIMSDEYDSEKEYKFFVKLEEPVLSRAVCLNCGEPYMYNANLDEEVRTTATGSGCPLDPQCPATMVEYRVFKVQKCSKCGYYRETSQLGYRYQVDCHNDGTYFIHPNGMALGYDVHCWTQSYPYYSFKSPVLAW